MSRKSDETIRQQAMLWLDLEPRSKEDIAQKMVEAINTTYDMVIDQHKLELQKALFEELIRHPPS